MDKQVTLKYTRHGVSCLLLRAVQSICAIYLYIQTQTFLRIVSMCIISYIRHEFGHVSITQNLMLTTSKDKKSLKKRVNQLEYENSL